MPVLEILTSSGLGSLLGMRHALEPDHLTAVSTLVTGERNSYRAAMLGAFWGLGHTLSLVVVGAVLVVLRAEMPARVSDLFELFVAVMLVGLGVRAMLLAVRQGPHRSGARASSRPPGAQPRRAPRRTCTSASGRSPAVRSWSAPCTAWPAAAR